MSERCRVLSLDEVALSQPGGPRWHVIRRTLGVQAFGIDAGRRPGTESR